MSERPNNNALSSYFQTPNSSSSQGIDIGPWKWRNRAEEVQLERRYVRCEVHPTGANDSKRSKFAIAVLRRPVLDCKTDILR
jgi:hypothetical protein